MDLKKLAINLLAVLAMLYLAGTAGVSAADLSPQSAQNPGVQETAQAIPVWQQVNRNGFGDLAAGEVSAVEAFGGYLYAGTHNPLNPGVFPDGAQIFRSADGETWTPVTQPGFGNSHDIAPPAILDMTVFNARLYAATGRGNASQLWRSENGTLWAPMDVTGFGEPENHNLTVLAEYDGMLYAGVTSQVSGAQIWRSYTGDNNTWTQVAPSTPGADVSSVTGMAVFDGALYASIESDAPVQIWRSYGGAWETLVADGFGDSKTTLAGGMAVFAGYLYAGAGKPGSGAQLYRTQDGTTWAPAITPGFGDPNNQKVEGVYVFQNRLYATVKNTATGMEVWRSSDGVNWERANQDGFGDSHNSASNKGNASAEFLGHLYVGTSNVTNGGELWRMQQPYGVDLSPDDSLSGPAGGQVVYTLTVTNTGTVTDTIDLSASGNTWKATLSTLSLTLAAGSSQQVTVSVSIPPSAAGLDSDSVSIQASSRQDAGTQDTCILTTSAVTGLPIHLYLGLVLRENSAKKAP